MGLVLEHKGVPHSCRIDMTVEHGNAPAEVEQARVLSVPCGLSLARGEAISIVDALPIRAGDEIRLTWDSKIFSWSTSAFLA